VEASGFAGTDPAASETEKDAVDEAVADVCENPLSGERLGGNLAGRWKVKKGLYRFKLRLIERSL
jgi:hypothetical protein